MLLVMDKCLIKLIHIIDEIDDSNTKKFFFFIFLLRLFHHYKLMNLQIQLRKSQMQILYLQNQHK